MTNLIHMSHPSNPDNVVEADETRAKYLKSSGWREVTKSGKPKPPPAE
jgi:hypothetical protein